MLTNTSLWTSDVEAEYKLSLERRDLYKGEHERIFITKAGRKLRFRYVPENLLASLSERLADLMFPKMPRILSDAGEDARTSESGRKEIERIIKVLGLEVLLHPTAIRASYNGNAVWRIVIDSVNKDPYLVLWGTHVGEFCTWEVPIGASRVPTAVNFWYHVGITDAASKKVHDYLIRERHWLGDLIGGKVKGLYLERSAFDTEKTDPATDTYYQVDWSDVSGAWPDGDQPLEEVFFPNIPFLPGFMIPNTDADGDGSGDTDYTLDRCAFQDGVNIIVSSRQFTVRMLEDPVIMQKSEYLDATQGVSTVATDGHMVAIPQLLMDPDQIKNVVQQPGDDGMPLSIVNWQSNLPGSEFQWTKLEDTWYKITPLCRELDGIVDAAAQSGYARRLALTKVQIAVDRRRRPYEDAFEWAITFTQALERARGKNPTPKINGVTVTWPNVIPDDPNEVSNRLTIAYSDNKISDFEYIQSLHPEWAPAQVAEEIARIDADTKRRNALAPAPASAPAIMPSERPALLQDGQGRRNPGKTRPQPAQPPAGPQGGKGGQRQPPAR
jgi:hypothetical protein